MSHDLEKIATDLSESIFARIEQDRCLIKQTIADVIHRELVFRFGRETPKVEQALPSLDEMKRFIREAKAEQRQRQIATPYVNGLSKPLTVDERLRQEILSGRAALVEQARKKQAEDADNRWREMSLDERKEWLSNASWL